MGKLIFISKAVKSGRSFVRRIIDLSKRIRHLHHKVRLNKACRDDIKWWIMFLPRWNGVSLSPDVTWTTNIDMELYTDASDLAAAGYFNGKWFLFQFQGPFCYLQKYNIAFRELLAIVIALATWAPLMRRKRILFHCDNLAVVHIIQSGTSKDSDIMNLVRTSLFIGAKYTS